MKKNLLLIVMCTSLYTYAQTGNVGINTSTPGSTLTLNGSFAGTYKTGTATSLDATDYYYAWNGTTAGTMTLPAVAAASPAITGRVYNIKNTGTATLTIAGSGSELLDNQSGAGVANISLSAGQYAQLIAKNTTSGTTWEVALVGSGSYVEPWNITGIATPATTNTQNIYQNGKVGIRTDATGTFTPAWPLHVQTSPNTDGFMLQTPTALAAGTYLQASITDATRFLTYGIQNSTVQSPVFVGTNSPHDFGIRTNAAEWLTVKNGTGYVGIGNLNPLVNLDIVGTSTNTLTPSILVRTPTGTNGALFLGNPNHGIQRNLTGSTGGNANDMAVFTTGADIYLVANPNASNNTNLPLNQFVLKSTGDVGIGTGSPQANSKLHVTSGDFGAGNGVRFSDNAGANTTNFTITPGYINTASFANGITLDVTGGGFITMNDHTIPSVDNVYTLGNSSFRWASVWVATGVVNSSDMRLKKNAAPLKYGLKEVIKLNPITYDWKDNSNKLKKIGFSAQQLQTIMPEVVSVGNDANKTLGVTYTDIIPVLVKAIQEQQVGIDEKDARIIQLEAKVKELEGNAKVTTELAAQLKEMQQIVGVKPKSSYTETDKL